MLARAGHWIGRGGIAAALVLGSAGMARANPIELHDQNSTAQINLGSDLANPIGMYSWTVDGVNRLFDQWFALRYVDDAYANPGGPVTHAGALDTLGTPTFSMIGDNGVSLDYNNGSIAVSVLYTLTGDAADSQKSTIAEQITVTNLMNRELQGADALHFFQYSDFDLCGPGSADSVSISAAGASQSSFCDGVVSEATVTPGPGDQWWPYAGAAFETGAQSDVALDALHGVDLNNNGSFSGGDAAWAFEWNIPMLASGCTWDGGCSGSGNSPGDSFTITKTKSLAPVPEPMSLMLFGSGLLGLGRVVRRQYSGTTV